MIPIRNRWPRMLIVPTAALIVANAGLPSLASAQSNLPQHYYMCQTNLMVGGKLNTYITAVNRADQDFTTDKLSIAPEAYGKAFMRYLIETYKPDNSSALEMETYNWGQTCSTSWPRGREGLEQSHRYTLSLGLAVEVDWVYAPAEQATPPD